MKVVVNRCYGGFGLSTKAMEMLDKAPWCKADCWFDEDDLEFRSSAELVAVVEELGEEANGEYADLAVVELPEGITDWDIDDYDGSEGIIYVLDGKINYA